METDNQSTPFEKAMAGIAVERQYQNLKWGSPNASGPHSVAEWLLIIESELAEAKDGWVDHGGERRALEELVQVAAVAVAALEQHGVYHEQKHLNYLFENTGDSDDYRK